MKRNRVINRWAVLLIVGISFLLIGLFKVPHYQKQQRLLALGYQKEEIVLLEKNRMVNEVLRKEVYSASLLKAMTTEDFQKKYVDLYIVRENVSKEDIHLYETLKRVKAYSDEELLKLFGKLPFFALRPLLVFDKVEVEKYLEDNMNHPNNTAEKFELSAKYLKAYDGAKEVEDSGSIEAFVSTKFGIGKYVPEKLVGIPKMYAIEGLQLRSEALQAFVEMASKLSKEVENEGIYAVSAYVSYQQQESNYNDYGLEADKYLLRPGYDDAQLGLSVRVVSSAQPSTSALAQTKSYQWLRQHAAEYGFIERYPVGKEAITSHVGDPSYWRFVGTSLAQKIKASGISFDEYYYDMLINHENIAEK